MRIASISKPITMAVVAKLIEDHKLDLDAPVSKYVKEWPQKLFEKEKVLSEIIYNFAHCINLDCVFLLPSG